MNRVMSKKKIMIIMLVVLITLQLTNIIYCFMVKKQGIHSDEIYSYATANNMGEPFLSIEGRNNKFIRYNNQWYDGDIFDDYLDVDVNERFAYGTIIHNQNDIHAPLFYLILHTICSFFPETFSWWYGFSINIVLFVVSMVFLFLLVRNITRKDYMAFLVCLLYGFSQGGINTFIYIRMYSLITCLAIISCYLHSIIYRNPEKFKKIIPWSVLVTFLGGLTHMYFLVFAGLLSACFCMYYLFNKQIKRMFAYGFSQVLAVVMFLVVHPYVLAEVLELTGQHEDTTLYGGLAFEFRYLVAKVLNELLGIEISTAPSYFMIHLVEVLLILLVVGLPLCFLLRKEIKEHNIIPRMFGKIKNMVKDIKEKFNLMIVTVAVVILAYMIVTASTAMVFSMGEFGTRYVFILYPYMMMLVVFLCDAVIRILSKFVCYVVFRIKNKDWREGAKKKHKIILLFSVILILGNIYINAPKHFYFEWQGKVEQKLVDMPREANYIVSLNDYWVLDCLGYQLRGVENFFVTRQLDFFMQEEALKELESDKPIYLLLSCPKWSDLVDEESVEVDEEFYEMMSNLSNYEDEHVQEFLIDYEQFCLNIYDEFEYIGNSDIFGRSVFIFSLK